MEWKIITRLFILFTYARGLMMSHPCPHASICLRQRWSGYLLVMNDNVSWWILWAWSKWDKNQPCCAEMTERGWIGMLTLTLTLTLRLESCTGGCKNNTSKFSVHCTKRIWFGFLSPRTKVWGFHHLTSAMVASISSEFHDKHYCPHPRPWEILRLP